MSVKTTPKFYHVTHKQNKQSILENGLQSKTKGIYVTTSKDAAINYGETILHGECVLFYCSKKLAKSIAKKIEPVDIISTVKGYEFVIITDRPIPFKVEGYCIGKGIRPYEIWEERKKRGNIIIIEHPREQGNVVFEVDEHDVKRGYKYLTKAEKEYAGIPLEIEQKIEGLERYNIMKSL